MASDTLLRRVNRNAAISCAAIAFVALLIDPARPHAALSVIGGALLVAFSYAAVAYTINVFMPPARARDVAQGGLTARTSDVRPGERTSDVLPGDRHGVEGGPFARRRKAVFALVLFAAHYALLAFVAYVMIARLRLHPIGLLGGVTSFVLAVAFEAGRPRAR